ncbi:MAG: precorrin-8X methylmutase [Hyphomicrobiales bacterium]
MTYLKDPAAIYERSFAIVRGEADLSDLPASIEPVAVRLMHACGMTDLVADLRFDDRVVGAAAGALSTGCAILADCEMARRAIIETALPAGNGIVCTLNDAAVPELARAGGTTRSAAAVSLWSAHLDGAVVVIGNAPTALFALLELIDQGAPKPAAILGFPVGFVGAAESKQDLADNPRGIPFITLLGRRGGSAMAGAALNAIALGMGS